MERRKGVLHVIAVLFFLIAATQALHPQAIYTSLIWVNAYGASPEMARMKFGNSTVNTSGVDSGGTIPTEFREYEAPPPSPGFECVWKPIRDGQFGSLRALLDLDLRDWGNGMRADTFRLCFAQWDNPSQTISLSWPDCSSLLNQCDSMFLVDPTGHLPRINMFAQDTLSIPAAGDSGIFELYIYKYSSLFLCDDCVEYKECKIRSDLFPLQSGLRASYLYRHESYAWWYGTYQGELDSGMVVYTVLGSTLQGYVDRAWHILEVKTLVHRMAASSPRRDTTFTSVDSLLFTMTERLEGDHALRSSSLIWNFPLSLGIADSTPVYRYSDSSHITLAEPSQTCVMIIPPVWENDALFSTDSGFVRLEKYFCADNDEYGQSDWTTAILGAFTITDAGQPFPEGRPTRFGLLQNYPNPFNPRTNIRFSLADRRYVSLKILDVLGREVAVLVREVLPPGNFAVSWDASGMPSGVYFCTMRTGAAAQTMKMLLIR